MLHSIRYALYLALCLASTLSRTLFGMHSMSLSIRHAFHLALYSVSTLSRTLFNSTVSRTLFDSTVSRTLFGNAHYLTPYLTHSLSRSLLGTHFISHSI